MGVQTLSNLREFRPLQSPFIKVNAEVVLNGTTNGKANIRKETTYKVSPPAKKIATYICNQIFGSDLVTSIPEGINWLMPTLREAMETGVYCKESFIYLHKFDNKVYLEIVKPNQLFNLVQKFDKIYSCTIVQEDEVAGRKLVLYRDIKLEDGKSFITLRAAEMDKYNKEEAITISKYNSLMGTDYKSQYILGYEVIINLDLGQDFFRDSKKLLIECTRIMDILNDELEKTRTRIATTNHFQSGNLVTKWQPQTNFNAMQVSVGDLQDYFTLMPGDKEHYLFQFLQGELRNQNYIDTYKFYDYQIIQMAGLSPASFGYEKDAYQNTASIDMNANASDMTIEAIKTQIEPQINKLLENIAKMQDTNGIKENIIPMQLEWNYGSNERISDWDKVEIIREMQRIASIPYEQRAEIIAPLLNKIMDSKVEPKDLIEAHEKEKENIKVEYGEL
jgi:hypothetical protein